MKKTILIPTDFSKNAWDAILYASELFKKEECDFYFLNVYNFPGYVVDSAFVTVPSNEVYKEFKELSEKKLKETIEAVDFRFSNPNHTYHSISQHNSLFYAVDEFVIKNHVDFIVMGTKGDTNSPDIIYGSNAVDIMENITMCNVLAIPEMTKYHPPKEIVFSTDFKSIDNIHKLGIAVNIAKENNAKICIVHVNTEAELSQDQEANKKKLEDYLKDVDYEIKNLSNQTLFEALQCLVQSRDSDMVTFFSKKHGVLKSIFSKPLVKSMGQRSKVPVLVLR